MSYSRTSSGQAAAYLFYYKPLVWVEGPEDVPFYSCLLGARCKIKSADGKPNCQKLAESLILNDYPYIVIMDGDYDILKVMRSYHRRVVLLHRHSCENYLFEKELVEDVCRVYARIDPNEDIIGAEFDGLLRYLDTELRELVILDVAHWLSNSGLSIFPKNVQELLVGNEGVTISTDCVATHCKKGYQSCDKAILGQSSYLVERFSNRKGFVHVLRGHFIFHMIWRFVRYSVKRKMGKTTYISYDNLRALLCVQVWKMMPSRDHRNLKRRLLKAVRETEKIR